jgi:hypothetical protein
MHMTLRVHAHILLAAAIFVAASAACSDTPAGPDRVPVGQPFELRVGSSSLVEGLTVRFDAVPSDSRCPLDSMCVWAGEAVVSLTLSRSDASVERQLKSAGAGSETTYAGLRVKLVRVDPYPRASDGRILQHQYVAALTVTRE